MHSSNLDQLCVLLVPLEASSMPIVALVEGLVISDAVHLKPDREDLKYFNAAASINHGFVSLITVTYIFIILLAKCKVMLFDDRTIAKKTTVEVITSDCCYLVIIRNSCKFNAYCDIAVDLCWLLFAMTELASCLIYAPKWSSAVN